MSDGKKAHLESATF